MLNRRFGASSKNSPSRRRSYVGPSANGPVAHFFHAPATSGGVQTSLREQTALMLKNFLKVALRNLWKHKGYSFLNVFGLAMGMTCSLLILLWIRDERSIDNFHPNGSRL